MTCNPEFNGNVSCTSTPYPTFETPACQCAVMKEKETSEYEANKTKQKITIDETE